MAREYFRWRDIHQVSGGPTVIGGPLVGLERPFGQPCRPFGSAAEILA
jgi:hypothetical protein